MWINIFDGSLFNNDKKEFYIIRWSIHNNCVVLKNGGSIVDDPLPIFEKYSIFDSHIGIDIESFQEEVCRSLEHIRQIIVEQYELNKYHQYQ